MGVWFYISIRHFISSANHDNSFRAIVKPETGRMQRRERIASTPNEDLTTTRLIESVPQTIFTKPFRESWFFVNVGGVIQE